LIGSLIALSACKKDKDEDLDTETQSSSDNFFVEGQVNDEIKEVDEAATNSKLGKNGPVITIDSTTTPRKMTIDYGTGTVCNDGKTRSGKINVTWTGRYRETGTVITISPENFVQNGNKIEGTKTIENKGRNTAGNLYYTISVINARITKADGRERTWNATRNREWISGEGTATWNDDVYLLTGNASGVNANGLNYSVNITSALRLDLGCEHRITAGVLELIPQGKRTRTVNYGNGDCDNTITVTIGNKTYTIN
jgi:hypothetical protein